MACYPKYIPYKLYPHLLGKYKNNEFDFSCYVDDTFINADKEQINRAYFYMFKNFDKISYRECPAIFLLFSLPGSI